MNIHTRTKYKIYAPKGECRECKGSGIRLHTAPDIEQVIPSGWTGACYHCNTENFNCQIRECFAEETAERIIMSYDRDRRMFPA